MGEITWLKRKYKANKNGKSMKRQGSGNSGNKGRNKINQQAKGNLPPQPVMGLFVDGGTGKARMRQIG